jgi:hypothetical protein
VIELIVATSTLVGMLSAVYVGFKIHEKYYLLEDHDKTKEMVGLISNIFVVVTSLVLGLMLNSAKNTFESNNNNVRTLASQIILLDRTMRSLEPEAAEARAHLLDYTLISLKEANIVVEDLKAEAALEAAGASLRAIHVSDGQKTALWNDARQLYRQLVQQRWVVVDTSGGTIPTPMIVLLILWLSATFAGFGYRAPDNAIVRGSFLIAALLIAGGLYVILDMDTPSSGLCRTSNLPFQRALAHLQQ